MEGIYLLGNQEFGWYKIGLSQNIESRVADISAIVPFAVQFVAGWPCQRKHLRSLESFLHKSFKPCRLKGEWFRLSQAEIDTIDILIDGWRKERGLCPAKKETGRNPLNELSLSGGISNFLGEGFTIADLPPGDPSYKLRFADPSDSERFAEWATNNPLISKDDLIDSMKANNPTSVTLVIEKDGVPIVFAPFYAQMNLGYLGFNPEFQGKTRLHALRALRNAASAFAIYHGVREVTVQSLDNYPVAQWAMHNGFNPERRQTFKLRLAETARGLGFKEEVAHV